MKHPSRPEALRAAESPQKGLPEGIRTQPAKSHGRASLLPRDNLSDVKSRVKACAFCPAQAVPLTWEHLWSDWIGKLFIGQEFSWRSIDPETSQTTQGKMKSFDRKVKAVCADCNNGWMSDLETAVQPLLSGVIRDGASMYFTRRDVTKLAAFTFKNAVIANYVNPEREPFFARAAREQFRATRQIPPDVHMWIAALSAATTTGAFWGYVGFVYWRSDCG
jgi:hypothetical protein